MNPLQRIIRERLERIGLTQREMGRAIGATDGAFVQAVLSGRKQIPLDKIEVWADALRGF